LALKKKTDPRDFIFRRWKEFICHDSVCLFFSITEEDALH